jgi:polysaccharide pyruvyl transferase WcaK-like protein
MILFSVRPTTRNIGNDLIGHATAELLYQVFGPSTSIVNVPALKGPQFGGLVASQVHDMNRLADGVVLGGGNLFENGQLSYQAQAVEALQPPLMLMGISHGRIVGRDGSFQARTDSLHGDLIRHLVRRSVVALVRDEASQAILCELGAEASVGGCPSLFLPANPAGVQAEGVIVSVRHPSRMSVPPALQWRVADDLRRLLAALRTDFTGRVQLACHDYIDLEFAAGFPDAVPAYFDDVHRYMAALRSCALHVSYRLHGFLPCLAFGTHSIHLSYDERGRSMLKTVGMEPWDVDLLRERDAVGAVIDRARAADRYRQLRQQALPVIGGLRQATLAALEKWRGLIVAAGGGKA